VAEIESEATSAAPAPDGSPDSSADNSTPSAESDVRDLAGGALVVFLGKIARVSRGGFLLAITLLCGKDIQGLFTIAWSVCSTLNKIARFGLLRSIVVTITEARAQAQTEGDRRAEHAALGAGLWIAIVASSAVVIGIQLAAQSIATFYDKPIEDALRIMACTAPFIALSWVFNAATRALRIMRYEVYVRSVFGPLILLTGGIAVGLAGFALTAIACVQLTMSIGNLGLSIVFFRRHFSLRDSFRAMWQTSPWRAMSRFGLPVALTDFVYALLTQLDVLMLGAFVHEATVGIYVLARQLASVVLKAPQAFDAIFSSIVSELSAQQRQGDLADRFVTIVRWILTVNLPIAACLLLVGDSILQVKGSGDLGDAADLELAIQVLFVLAIGMMLQSVFAVAEPLLAMSGRPGLNFLNNVIWLAVNATLNLWLIKKYGAVGAAIGASIAMLLVSIMRVAEVYFFRRIVPVSRTQLKPLAAGVGAAVPTWLLCDAVTDPLWRAILSCLVFLSSYLGILVLLRPELEDRMLLARCWRSIRRRLAG
jgi:O-antigen/teichoic acid export membrane protein